MGSDEFKKACVAMGVYISEELAKRAVRSYRVTYPQISPLWRRLDDAAEAKEGIRYGK